MYKWFTEDTTDIDVIDRSDTTEGVATEGCHVAESENLSV